MADGEAKPVDQHTLVADIDRTRTELARTIDAIADRVSPKKNVDRVKEEVSRRVSQVQEELRRRASQVQEEFRRRASQVDPLVAGGAAAVAVVTTTAFFIWRRRKH